MFCGGKAADLRVVCESPICQKAAADLVIEGEKRRQEERKREAAEFAMQAASEIYGAGGMVELYRETRFKDILVDSGNVKAVKAAYNFVHNRFMANTPRAFILVGTEGTGKTMLAYAIANEFCDLGMTPGYFCARESRYWFPEFCGNKEIDSKLTTRATEMKEHYSRARVAMLDDLGYEGDKPSAGMRKWLSETVNKQYSDGRRLLLITSEMSVIDWLPKTNSEGYIIESGRYDVAGTLGTESLVGRLRAMAGGEYVLSGPSWRGAEGKIRAANATPFNEWRKEERK